MISHYHAADFEVASHRARRRWAEHIDGLLGDGSVACAPSLGKAHDILLDPTVEVRSSDLHQLMQALRDAAVMAECTPEQLRAFVASYSRPA